MTNRRDESLHVKWSWKFPQVDVSVPDFCPEGAEPRLGLFGREGVPGNAAAGSTLRVLWINGTQTCKGIPATATARASHEKLISPAQAGLLLTQQSFWAFRMN